MRKYLLGLSVLLLTVSCGNTGKNKVEGSDAQATAVGVGQELVVDTQSSFIHWKGFKVGGEHYGTIDIKSGSLTINENEVTSGAFIVDMNSIIDQDLKEKSMNDMLVNHLKSEAFFDVTKYPECFFTITKITPNEVVNDSVSHLVSGNLKMKDVEKNITFGAKITKEGDVYRAVTVPFTIDRTQWNVKYGSKTLFPDLKDKIVSDNIELHIIILAKASSK